MMGILSGVSPLMVDVRQTGGSPFWHRGGTLENVADSRKDAEVARGFDRQRLVAEVHRSFTGFHFTIQAVRPPDNYPERVKSWYAARADAEKRGLPFIDPPPSIGTRGSASFVQCLGEERDTEFVLEISMKTDAGRLFVVFIEEKDMVPEPGGSDPGIDLEASIADHLAFWTLEMICHGTVEDLDGRAVGSRKWMKVWK